LQTTAEPCYYPLTSAPNKSANKTMVNNGKAQSAKKVFQNQSNSVINPQTHGDVRQDKARGKSARVGTRQPAPHEQPPRAQPLNPNFPRSKPSNVQKTRTVQLTVWVQPVIKAEIQRLAAQEGLSISATSAAFLEKALQQHIDMQYSALLQPIIENAIKKQMQGMATRFASLLVRVAFDAGQTKSLVTNLLGRQPGVTEEVLKNILARTQQLAKGNITRRTPQLTELIEAVEKWLAKNNEEQDN
jgi:hypothetical protein